MDAKRKGDQIIIMSDKNIIEKAVDVVGNVTKFQKQSKMKAEYVEREEFKDSDLHAGYFCYNCIYWVNSGLKMHYSGWQGP